MGGLFILKLGRSNVLTVLLMAGGLAVSGLTPQGHAQNRDHPGLDRGVQGVVLTGPAQIVGDTRDVFFAFSCTSNVKGRSPKGRRIIIGIGMLGVDLIIPQPEELRTVFDFDAFDGEDFANVGELSSLEATGAHGSAQAKFAVSGTNVFTRANDQRDYHVLSVEAPRLDDAARLSAVASVLRPLTEGASKLVWRQGNVKPGGPPIVATLDVAAADAARLRSLLSPCLAGAPHAALQDRPAGTMA